MTAEQQARDLLERITELEKEIAALEEVNDRERHLRKAAERARDAETQYVKILEYALRRYGEHDQNCDKLPSLASPPDDPLDCSCGLDTALEKVAE